METLETQLCEREVRVDRRGRRTMKPEERERLIGEYEVSGVTQAEFCRREGLNEQTFSSWLGKYRKNGNKKRVFREVRMPGGGVVAARTLEVQLPGGEVVRGSDAKSLADLVKLLRA